MPDRQNTITIPPRLNSGDAIGIAAPASHFDRTAFDRGVGILKSLGLRPVIPEGVFEKQGYFAGSDRSRSATLNQLFGDPGVQAIICARGGFGSLRTLEYLDLKAISRTPKIFIGFSDATTLLSAFVSKCRLAVFHGPTVTTLAASDARTHQSLLGAVSSGTPVAIRAEAAGVIQPGRAHGPVVGGNLTTLCHLIGTGFFPKLDGKILLLEDRGEAPYRIDRMLTQMTLAGCFQAVAGIALGSFETCGDIDSIHRIFQERFRDSVIPVCGGFPVGHGRSNLTVPIGIDGTLDADGGSLIFQTPATLDTQDET